MKDGISLDWDCGSARDSHLYWNQDAIQQEQEEKRENKNTILCCISNQPIFLMLVLVSSQDLLPS
jgi:hypothetical protein